MTILGIDPGLGSTGWAVLVGDPEHPVLSGYGAIHTDPRLDLAQRLLVICEGIRELLARHRPEEVAVEDVFLARDTRAALALGQARGAAMLGAALGGVPVRSYSAREIKQSVTGNGRASKEQVAFMVERLLGLSEPPRPADCADAAAIALCHLHRREAADLRAVGARQ
ncbi:MAG: crossover junction endodeoxyribonuclease RuvC [Candidatus Zixiibacteriota bacterium]